MVTHTFREATRLRSHITRWDCILEDFSCMLFSPLPLAWYVTFKNKQKISEANTQRPRLALRYLQNHLVWELLWLATGGAGRNRRRGDDDGWDVAGLQRLGATPGPFSRRGFTSPVHLLRSTTESVWNKTRSWCSSLPCVSECGLRFRRLPPGCWTESQKPALHTERPLVLLYSPKLK